MRGLYGSLKLLSYTVLLLMLGSMGYAFVISLLHWSDIGV